jgi:uncharacterized protein (DUF2141 family)
VNRPGKLSVTLAFFPLFMASMAVAAVWLVEPAQAESPAAATGQGLNPQSLASLTITIGKVSPRGGILRLGLYDAAGYPRDDSQPIASADIPVTGSQMTVTLKDIPPGRYAIESLQDINGNGKMDSSFLGLPEEPYGFSRDARPFLSKPGFDAAAFTLSPGENVQSFSLQNS